MKCINELHYIGYTGQYQLHFTISGILEPKPQVRLQLISLNMEFSKNWMLVWHTSPALHVPSKECYARTTCAFQALPSVLYTPALHVPSRRCVYLCVYHLFDSTVSMFVLFVNPFFKKKCSTNPQSLLFQGFTEIKKSFDKLLVERTSVCNLFERS